MDTFTSRSESTEVLVFTSPKLENAMDEGAGRFGGILVTIAILAILNGLSYAFNWGWYFY